MNQEKIKKKKKKKAFFLDRDGVLNFDSGYTYQIKDFKWIPGAKKAIKLLKDLGFLIIVITNQSGVSRGFYSEEDVKKLHNWMNMDLKKISTSIDDFFFCTELPNEKDISESRRKPSPAMLNEAILKYNLSRNLCFFLGDKKSDLEASKNAKIKGFLFTGGDLHDEITKILKEN
tara:strand:+ start:132 stop:653 length:522 start_codon:yes stop_codon:yes gene_type:complete